MAENFFVSMNDPVGKATIHCFTCNLKKNKHKHGGSDEAVWHGPFTDVSTAQAFAHKHNKDSKVDKCNCPECNQKFCAMDEGKK